MDVAAITLGQAMTIVEAALGRARETSCAPLAVAVLDDGGHLKAFAVRTVPELSAPRSPWGRQRGRDLQAFIFGMMSRAILSNIGRCAGTTGK